MLTEKKDVAYTNSYMQPLQLTDPEKPSHIRALGRGVGAIVSWVTVMT